MVVFKICPSTLYNQYQTVLTADDTPFHAVLRLQLDSMLDAPDQFHIEHNWLHMYINSSYYLTEMGMRLSCNKQLNFTVARPLKVPLLPPQIG